MIIDFSEWHTKRLQRLGSPEETAPTSGEPAKVVNFAVYLARKQAADQDVRTRQLVRELWDIL